MMENKMGVMPVRKLVFNMALPMMISMLVQALYNVVDSVFVAAISEQSLTAVSLAFPAQNLMISVSSGTAVGVNALLSRALGSGDREKADEIAHHGLFLAIVSAILFLVLGLTCSQAFFRAQTTVPEIIAQGETYLMICTGASFGLFLQMMLERLLQATGRTFHTMISQGTGAIVNIILDAVFILVFHWGVAGAAIATVLGQIIGAILALYYNVKKNPDLHLKLKGFRPRGHVIGKIYEIGFPSIIMMAVGSITTFCMNKILISFTLGKETAATVYGIYFKLNSLIFMPVFGLCNSIIPIVAYNYGAQNKKRMTQAIGLGCAIASCIMLAGTALFLLVPEELLVLFQASENMMGIGVPAMRIVGSTFICAAIGIILGGAAQAVGKSVFSLFSSLIRQLLVLVPCAYLLAKIGLATGQAQLVWYAVPISEVLSLFAALLFYLRIYKTVICPLPEN